MKKNKSKKVKAPSKRAVKTAPVRRKHNRAVRKTKSVNRSTASILFVFLVIGIVSVSLIFNSQSDTEVKEVVLVKSEVPVMEEKKDISKETPKAVPAPKPAEPKQESVKENKPEKVPEQKKSEEETQRIAYLTFDADMTPKMKRDMESGRVSKWYSPGIIEYLKENDIPATIFVTGMFAEAYPELVLDMAQSGFSIQNHTYSHKAFTKNCYNLGYAETKEEKHFELQRTQEILTAISGKTPRYVRLPGLCTNAEAKQIMKEMGLMESNSGVVSDDAFQHSLDEVVQNVLKKVTDGKNIIILHAGGPNAIHTEAALKIIVPNLKKRGYRFEKM